MSKEKEKEKDKERQSDRSAVATEARAPGRPNGREDALARSGPATPAFWSSHPFAMLHRFADEMDRVFEGFGFGPGPRHRPSWPGSEFELAAWSPQVELFQRDDRLVVRADLPGLKRDDVQVEVMDDAVTIKGERHQEHQERREGYFHTERSYGSFCRRIPLPEGVEADKADASFRDGVLEITMPAPHREATQARRLEVKG